MKKMISFLLVLAMVMSMSVTVFAATPSVNKTTVAAGEEITVTISLDRAYDEIATWDLHLHFDPTLFELVKGEIAEGQRSSIIMSNLFKESYEVEGYSYYKINDIDTAFEGFYMPAGDLYYVTFKALDDITADAAAQFVLVSGDWMDTSFNEFEDPINNGIVNIEVTTTADDKPVMEGYTVSLTPAEQTKVTNEKAQVIVNVESDTAATFNSFDMTLTYDNTQLTLTTTDLGNDHYTITDNNGTIRIQGYGQDVNVGEALALEFDLKNLTDSAEVELISAKVDVKNNALQDAPAAELGNTTAIITLGAYTVNLPEDFIGENSVKPGDDYTFEAKDKNYDYVINATMGGEEVTVTDNGDGTYTIEDVNGNIEITSTKTPKSFDVIFDGTGKDDASGIAQATYLTPYVFTVTEAADYTYEVSMTIGGNAYTGYTVENSTYTIPGKDITGEIKITIAKTQVEAGETTVKFEGSGAGDATGEAIATIGKDYTFALNKVPGDVYDMAATMNGAAVTIVDNGDGTYTIENVSGPIVIVITKTEAPITVEVNQYVKLDNKVIYLITAACESMPEGQVLAYENNVMFWSEEYGAYAYLVISDTELTVDAASALVTKLNATAETIIYTGDVNGTTVNDINDAQMVYNMYNAEYDDFDTVSMSMFLRADMNGDKTLTILDSAAVVATIQ